MKSSPRFGPIGATELSIGFRFYNFHFNLDKTTYNFFGFSDIGFFYLGVHDPKKAYGFYKWDSLDGYVY